MKSNKLLTQQEQETIPAELISKFDNDKELVQEFISEGYSISELQASTVLHPTKFDPLVMIGDRTAGMWLDGGKKYQENSRTYQNRTNRFF
jgi:hypothetical protein